MMVCTVGCSSTSRSAPPAAQSIRIETSDPGAVYSVGLALMRREFTQVQPAASELEINTTPELYQTRDSSGTARDYYGGASQMRRSGWMKIERVGPAVRAYVRVAVERLDTRRQELFTSPTGRLSDAPGRTPIEEDAATTQSQNTLWTSAGRDRGLERKLLTDLLAEFDAGAPPATAGDVRRMEQAPADPEPEPALEPELGVLSESP
jgi:hypothetical protein